MNSHLRSLFLTLGLAFGVFTLQATASNSTWTGASSNLWSTSGNWSGGTPSSTTTAQFSTTFSTQPTLSGTASSVGGIWATTGLGQDVTIGATTGTLTIVGNLTAANGPGGLANTAILLDDSANHNLTINAPVAITNSTALEVDNAGTLSLNGSVTITAGKTVTFKGTNASGVTTVNGVIGATSGALTVNTSGTVNLTNTNLETGATTVTAGTLNLSSFTGSVANSAVVVASGATLGFDSNSGTATGTVTRAASLSIGGNALGNGRLIVTGSSAASTVDAVTGALSIASDGVNYITVNPNSATAAHLTFGSLTHGTGSILFVNGTNLGANGSGTSNVGRILFNTAPAFVGSQDDGGSGAGSDQAVGIIPYLLGEVSTTSGGGGTVTGTANTFVTYNSATGLRPIDLSSEYVQNSFASGVADGNNVRITTATSGTFTNSVNSLLISGGSVAISSGITETIASGALLFTTSNNITGGTILFNIAAPGYITMNGGGLTGTITSKISTGNYIVTDVGAGSSLTLSGGMTCPVSSASGTWDIYGGGTVTLNGGSNWGATSGGFANNLNVLGVGTVVNMVNSPGFQSYLYLRVNGGATVDLNSNLSVTELIGGSVGNGLIKTTGGNLVLSGGTDTNAGETITGGKGIAYSNPFAGTASHQFIGVNNYSGGTSITPNSGSKNTLILGNGSTGGNTLSDTGFVLLGAAAGNSAILDLNGIGETIGTLKSGTIGGNLIITNTSTATSSTLAINTAVSGNGNYIGTISGSATNLGNMSVTKKGVGTETLAGVETYQGRTTINNGTLAVDFSQYGGSLTNTPADYLSTGDVLTLGGGTLGIIGRANGGTTSAAAATTNGSANITYTAIPAGIVVGQAITGTNIPAGSYVVAIVGNTVTLSGTATATSASVTVATTATTVTTSQTLGNLTLTGTTGSNIVVNSNGGAGTTLTLGNTWARGAGSALGIDISSANTAVNSGATGQLSNGIISYATVTDGTSTGFATISGTSVIRYTGATVGLPTSGSSATTNYTTSGNVTLAANESVNSLAINASSTNALLNLGGSTLSGTGTTALGVLQTGSKNATISNGQIGANNTEVIVQQYGTGTLTISGTLSGGTGSLTKAGPGTLVLTGSNTYSGGTNIDGGILNFTSSANLGTGTIFFGGGTLQYATGNTTDITSARAVATNGGGGTIDTNGNNVTLNGVVSGSGGLAKSGSGTLTLAGLNSYTGDTTINAGTLLLDLSTNTTGVIASRVLSTYVSTGSALLLNGGSLVVKGASSGASSQLFGGLAANSGEGQITVLSNGGSGVTLTVNDTWNRQTGATVNFDLSSSAANVLQSSTVSNTNGIIGGWLTLTDSTGTGFAYYTDATLLNATNPIARFTGATALTGTTNASTTNYTLTGTVANTSTGTHAVNSLAIDTSAGAATLTLGGTLTTITSGGLLMTGSNNATISGGQLGASGAELIVNQYGTGTLTISGTISGTTGILTKAGPGALIVSTGTNTYSGGTYLNQGALVAGASTTVAGGVITKGPFGTGLITMASGSTFQDNGSAITLANALSLSGTITFGSTGSGNLTFDSTGLTLPSTVLLTGNTTLVVNNITTINDSFSNVNGYTLTKLGTGLLSLTGTGTNQGTAGTNVSAGTLAIANASNLGSGLISLAGGTSLQYTGATGTVGQNISLTGTVGSTGAIGNTGGGLLTLSGTLDKTNRTLIFNAGNIDLTGAVVGGTTSDFNSDMTVTGTSTTVTLDNANTFTGTTNINGGGTLKDGAGTLPAGTVLSIGASGDGVVTNTFDLNGDNQTVAAINSTSNGGNTNVNKITNTAAGSGTSTLTLSGLNSDSTPTSSTYGGTITDGSTAHTALAITGGTHTFSGASTYTGGTAISNAKFVVTNTSGSAVGTGAFTLNSTGTLAGTGKIVTTASNTISGAVQVGYNGTANTTGSLTLATTGTTTFSGASLTFNLNGASPGQSNTLNVGSTGNVFFGAGTTLTLNLLNTTTTIDQTMYTLFSTTESGGGTLASQSIFGGTGVTWDTTTGIISGLNFTINNSSAPAGFYNNSYLVFVGNGNGAYSIDVQVVPEPGTWALMLGGFALLVIYQRSRRSKNNS